MARRIVGLTGNGAAAEAMRQIDPDVVAAYPITPQTEIVERFAEYVADGAVNTEFVTVESEFSAISACCGASAAGARAMTATSSQGLALMHEMLYITAGHRLPVVMVNVNRALSAPINIHNDHSDSMGSRDAGWIQLYCESAQEVYDSCLQAVRIAEHRQVLLPVMVNLDGFVVSHSVERLELLDDDEVKDFVGEFEPAIDLLDVDNPVTLGALALPEYYFEIKYAQVDALHRAEEHIRAIDGEFRSRFGRGYGLIEGYQLEDAELILVTLGSVAGTARVVVDELRLYGQKAGLLKLRCYRPFPAREVAAALARARAVAVVEKAVSPGAPAPAVFSDVRNVLYDAAASSGRYVPAISYVAGPGGRDVPAGSLHRVFEHLRRVAEAGVVGRTVNYLDLRGWE